jgi:hypothetical protein
VGNENSQEAAGVRTNLYHTPYPEVPPSSIPLCKNILGGIRISYALFSFAYPPWLRAKTFRLIKSDMKMSSS